jgi:hypothetical protein
MNFKVKGQQPFEFSPMRYITIKNGEAQSLEAIE